MWRVTPYFNEFKPVAFTISLGKLLKTNDSKRATSVEDVIWMFIISNLLFCWHTRLSTTSLQQVVLISTIAIMQQFEKLHRNCSRFGIPLSAKISSVGLLFASVDYYSRLLLSLLHFLVVFEIYVLPNSCCFMFVSSTSWHTSMLHAAHAITRGPAGGTLFRWGSSRKTRFAPVNL